MNISFDLSPYLSKISPMLQMFAGGMMVILSVTSIAGEQAENQTSDDPHAGHGAMDHSKHQAQLKAAGQDAKVANQKALNIPNVMLTNEQGDTVNVIDDVIGNKIVVLNTIYTTCTTVCPVMGVQFARLQKLLLEQLGSKVIEKEIVLVSVSIDPLNDTPQRLQHFKKRYNGRSGWTLLTGSQGNVDKLLKATGLFAADKEEHTPITLVGSTQLGSWTRLSGLGPAKQIAQFVDDLVNKTQSTEAAKAVPPAQQYFSDVTLIDQHGQPQRFYQDLLKDKVVIIHSFFSSCKSGCPVSMRLMAGIQERFAGQMGKQLHILSISLDPQIDTPLKLQAYAKELKVGPGWQLISGDKVNVDFALKKLGHYVSDIESHKNTIIIGNEATGLWKKAFLLAPPAALDKVIRSVIDDEQPVTAAVE
ncbi:MAG: SCO family protein [Algicola sp.]|nr:SCO family protein [Algicola sp.]